MVIRWLTYLHILAALTFFLSHGTSVAMAFKIRKETNIDRIKAMLDLSGSTVMALFISFLVMGLSGLALPFIYDFWGTGWVWTSIALTLFIFIWMWFFNERTYIHLRKLVGLPYMVGNKRFPAGLPASHESIQTHIQSINVHLLATVGYGVPAVILWLMTFKPF